MASSDAPVIDGPNYNEEKMRQVILYFIHHGDPETLGKTKLMKLLYYADFDHFELHDEPITGAVYRRLRQGPVATDVFALLGQMAKLGDIDITSINTPSYQREKYKALRPFSPALFSDDEMSTLKAVANRWHTVKMTDIVAASHDDPPWNAVGDNEEIPYYLVYYRNTYGELSLSDDEVDASGELITEDEFFNRPVYSR